MQFTNTGEFVCHSAGDNDRRLTYSVTRSRCLSSYQGGVENVAETVN